MADLRTTDELKNNPCIYSIKEYVKNPVVNGVEKVKKTIQRIDENGNPVYKTVKVPVKKGCGCNGTSQSTELVEKQLPVMDDVWIEQPVNGDNTMVLCKLFGSVKKSHCLNCKSYKGKK